jgi:gas vesicle protein
MNRESTALSQAAWLLGGFAVGALAMYISDPEMGRRRRAFATDRVQNAMSSTGNYISDTTEDLGNRMQGLRAEAEDLLPSGNIIPTERQRFDLASSGLWMLGGAVLGALTMFLNDPEMGRRRRALAGDKLRNAASNTKDYALSAARDWSNRAQGLGAEASGLLREGGEKLSSTMH